MSANKRVIMTEHRLSFRWIDLVPRSGRPKVAATRRAGAILRGLAVSLLTLALAGCGGGGSAGGTAQATAAPDVTAAGAAALTASTALNTTITGVTINGPPVVNFTVTNQAGVGMAGLTSPRTCVSTSPSWCRDRTAARAPGRTTSTGPTAGRCKAARSAQPTGLCLRHTGRQRQRQLHLYFCHRYHEAPPVRRRAPMRTATRSTSAISRG